MLANSFPIKWVGQTINEYIYIRRTAEFKLTTIKFL